MCAVKIFGPTGQWDRSHVLPCFYIVGPVGNVLTRVTLRLLCDLRHHAAEHNCRADCGLLPNAEAWEILKQDQRDLIVYPHLWVWLFDVPPIAEVDLRQSFISCVKRKTIELVASSDGWDMVDKGGGFCEGWCFVSLTLFKYGCSISQPNGDPITRKRSITITQKSFSAQTYELATSKMYTAWSWLEAPSVEEQGFNPIIAYYWWLQWLPVTFSMLPGLSTSAHAEHYFTFAAQDSGPSLWNHWWLGVPWDNLPEQVGPPAHWGKRGFREGEPQTNKLQLTQGRGCCFGMFIILHPLAVFSAISQLCMIRVRANALQAL